MENADIESHEIAEGITILATPERAWIRRGEKTPAACSALDGGRAEARTRRLLDAAVAAAFPAARPDAVPPLTPTRWIHRLAGLYHLTHSTPRLLRVAADRFAERGEATLVTWALKRAREESNHDVLALRDLRAMGVDAERVVQHLRPESTMRLLSFFIRAARAEDPIAAVGYAYAIERLAMTVDRSAIERVEQALPRGVRATRCLRVHSAVGSDADHVEDTVKAVAALAPERRAAIAIACHETARLCFEPPPSGHVPDEAIASALASL